MDKKFKGGDNFDGLAKSVEAHILVLQGSRKPVVSLLITFVDRRDIPVPQAWRG